MPEYEHRHHFGSRGMRDYTLINDKNSKFYIPVESEREKVKNAYRSRHRNDNIDDVHSAGALSWHILWSEPTLKKGIKAYSKRFGVVVVDRT